MTYSSNIIFEPKALREKVNQYLDQPKFIWDCETMGGDYRGEPNVNNIVWASFATEGDAFVIPMGHPNGDRMLTPPRKRKNKETGKFDMFPATWEPPPDQMRPAEVFEILHPLFFNEEIEKGGHGVLFDFLSVWKYYEAIVPGPYHDSLLAWYLLNENRAERGLLGLKEITKWRYKRDYDKESVGKKVEIHPFWKVAQYAYMDAKYTWLNLKSGLERLAEEDLMGVYGLEMDTMAALIDMGLEGIEVDREDMERLDVVLSERRTNCEINLYRAAGKKFNINSNPQKTTLLFGSKKDGNQGLKPWMLTDGGRKKAEEGEELTLQDYSTKKEALEQWIGKNDVVDALLAYQEVDRVLGTYIKGYLGEEVPGKKKRVCQIFEGNKVYPDFVQYGTVTGRFSCRTPNLQNIPRPDTDLGKEVRGLFIAGEGNKLIVADYGQVELVVLAHYVGHGALYDGFFEGIDPHTMTAALVFNEDPHRLTARIKAEDPEAKHWRQIAKNLNFAIVYGAGDAKVASMSGISLRRAKEVLAIHEEQFPEIYRFKDKALRQARDRKPPYLRTLSGRKRRIPTLHARDYKTRGRAERQMINSLIQGSAADLIKVAMVRTHRNLREAGCGKMLLTVHDELVNKATIARAEECAERVTEAMTGSGIQKMVDVPLKIDLKIVDRWSEAK